MLDQLKLDLIETGKRMIREGLVSGTGGNISARLPGSGQFLMTPSGMAYEDLLPEDLVMLNLAGEVVSGERKPSIERGLHLLVYQNRPDVNAVVHTHSLYASAVAVTRKTIPPILDSMVGVLGGGVETAEYAPHGSMELAENCIARLGRGKAVLLANHGAVGVGTDIGKAYQVCQTVEQAAQVYLFSSLIGGAVELPVEVVEYEKEFMRTKYGQTGRD